MLCLMILVRHINTTAAARLPSRQLILVGMAVQLRQPQQLPIRNLLKPWTHQDWKVGWCTQVLINQCLKILSWWKQVVTEMAKSSVSGTIANQSRGHVKIVRVIVIALIDV